MADGTCARCGEPTPRKDAKYCSRWCMSRAFSGPETCTVDGCDNPHRAKGLCSTHYNQRQPTRHAAHHNRNAERKRATDLSHHKRRRAVLRGADAELIDRDDIARRDHWTCWLCRKLVDPTVKWPDVMCASLDHVVPLSAGGDHHTANVRLAHFLCNVRRGDRAHGEQLSLIG